MQFVPGKMMENKEIKTRGQDQGFAPVLKYTEEDQRWKSNM